MCSSAPAAQSHTQLRCSAQGKAPRQAVEKLQSSFMPVFRAGWVFWPAANMINFLMVPPTGRVLYVNCAGLLWNAYLRRVLCFPFVRCLKTRLFPITPRA